MNQQDNSIYDYSDEAGSISASSTKKYGTPCPSGWTAAVFVDFYVKRNVTTMWGIKDYVYFVWETPFVDPMFDDGRRITVWARYNYSLDDRSNLFGMLTSYMGRSPSPDAEVKLQLFIHRQAYLNIVYGDSGDPENPYVNVNVVAQIPSGIASVEPSGTYIRRKDRTPNAQHVNYPPATAQTQVPPVQVQAPPQDQTPPQQTVHQIENTTTKADWIPDSELPF